MKQTRLATLPRYLTDIALKQLSDLVFDEMLDFQMATDPEADKPYTARDVNGGIILQQLFDAIEDEEERRRVKAGR